MARRGPFRKGMFVRFVVCSLRAAADATSADEAGRDSTAPQTALSIRLGFIISVFSWFQGRHETVLYSRDVNRGDAEI